MAVDIIARGMAAKALQYGLSEKVVVASLPQTGSGNTLYFVGPKKDSQGNDYYEEYIWVNDTFEPLGSTAAIDLSGYLPIQNGVTTNEQAYTKNADGTQGMVDVVVGTSGGSIVKRTSNGQVSCADATADNHAVNRGFANQTYRGKMTGTTTKDQAYVKFANGTQGGVDIDVGTSNNTLVRRTAAGQISCADPTADNHGANKKYVDDKLTATLTQLQDGTYSLTFGTGV